MRIRATTLLRNHAMIEARLRLGYSQKKLAQIANVPFCLVGRLEALDYTYGGIDTISVGVLADILGLASEEIAPQALAGKTIPSRYIQIQSVDPNQMLQAVERRERRLIEASPDDILMAQENRARMIAAVAKLPDRLREIIKLRYGLDGGYCYSRSEIARIYKLSPERIRQSEAKAVQIIQKIVAAEDSDSTGTAGWAGDLFGEGD